MKRVHDYGDLNSLIKTETRTAAARSRRPELDRDYIVPALAKALRIIQVIGSSATELNVNEIVRRTGYPKTTVYRTLRTLAAFGYFPEGKHGVYRLDISRPTLVFSNLDAQTDRWPFRT
jgi:uncharacterized membrane protein